MLEPGTRLGEYEILSSLGAGGMGEVYRARDARLQRDVAIKVLPDDAADSAAIERFEREARSVAALAHPNIMSIFQFGEERGVRFAVVELIDGNTLREELASRRLPLRKALDIAMQIARGLEAAHERGIIHRDLKPENVMVQPDGAIKILDFGLARRESRPAVNENESTAVHLTRPGALLGTPAYMSPEQVRGETADARSDIFAAGAILYEMLTGTKAFARDSVFKTLSAILHEEPPAIDELNAEVPPALARIVQRCLEKRPQARFRSAADLVFALEQVAGTPAASAGVVKRRAHRTAWIGTVLAVVLVVLAIALVPTLRRRSAPSAVPPRKSLAVLPFVNMSADKENEYFSDGVTEDLITVLAKVSGLRVAARTSSFVFRGKNMDVREVARALGVDAVLEGSVAKAGNRVRINAQLINGADGYHLWSDSYDRDLRDIFALRSELAQTVASALEVRLLAGERQAIQRKPTGDLAAYDLYLRARHEISSFTPAGFERGQSLLQEAIARDPNYALAHLGIAYYSVGMTDFIPGSETLPRVIQSAGRAAQLDPSLAEAHADLAWAHWILNRDHRTARREFELAFRAQPDSAYAREVHGWYLVATGATERGLAESKRGVDLDPLSPETNTVHGFNLYFARRYQDAARILRGVLVSNPHYYWAHEFLGRTYLELGDLDAARNELKIADRIAEGQLAEIQAAMAQVRLRQGDRQAAQAILDELYARRRRGSFVPSYHLGAIELAMGNRERALTLLEQGDAERSFWQMWLPVDPQFDSIRADPRFRALLRKLE